MLETLSICPVLVLDFGRGQGKFGQCRQSAGKAAERGGTTLVSSRLRGRRRKRHGVAQEASERALRPVRPTGVLRVSAPVATSPSRNGHGVLRRWSDSTKAREPGRSRLLHNVEAR